MTEPCPPKTEKSSNSKCRTSIYKASSHRPRYNTNKAKTTHTAQENPGLRYQGVVNFVASESMKPRKMKMATMIASLIIEPKFEIFGCDGPSLVSKNRKGVVFKESGANWSGGWGEWR